MTDSRAFRLFRLRAEVSASSRRGRGMPPTPNMAVKHPAKSNGAPLTLKPEKRPTNPMVQALTAL